MLYNLDLLGTRDCAFSVTKCRDCRGVHHHRVELRVQFKVDLLVTEIVFISHLLVAGVTINIPYPNKPLHKCQMKKRLLEYLIKLREGDS